MSRFNITGYIFMEVRVTLQQGKMDLYSLLSRLERYRVEVWDETYKRRPDRRGRMGYREAEITLWVHPEDYQPLCNTLGKWMGPEVEYFALKPEPVGNLVAPL